MRYRGPDGRFKSLEPIAGSFPLAKAVRRRRKKGESEAHAFERITEQKIRAAVFRSINEAEGVQRYTPAVERALASGDAKKIGRAMKAFRERRSASFKITVERHVTGQGASNERRARKLPRKKPERRKAKPVGDGRDPKTRGRAGRKR